MGTCPLCLWSYRNTTLRGRDSWRVTTPHVQSFVLISMLRGQPKTPPSDDDLTVLDFHLKSRLASCKWWVGFGIALFVTFMPIVANS